MNTEVIRAGLYGKMPTVGDFVCRGFSPQTAAQLDSLFQGSLTSACEGGRDLYQIFDAAPVFMLSVRPGVMAAAGVSVLVMPSCDRVGRLFPLCAGIEWSEAEGRAPLGWPLPELMRDLCRAMINVTGNHGGPDDLWASLLRMSAAGQFVETSCPFSLESDMTVPPIWNTSPHMWFQGPASAMSPTAQAVCAYLPWVAQALGCALSPEGTIESYFSTRALHAPSILGALFDAEWSGHGWDTYPLEGGR